ncbi:MAG: BamA/TamA family outer membrane protein [Nitrospirae bacterium]|nr:BamA/TamA family outer membrane protein [Nitrospirota bacterium]
MKCAVWIVLWLGIVSANLAASSAPARAAEASQPAVVKEPSKFISAEDGWLDVSAFLDEKYGFLPIVIPITEPAVGYGAAGGLAFIDKPFGKAQAGFSRPNITFVGGMGTENGTWGVMAGDMRHWMGDRLQTLVGVVKASVNLDFYGIGRDNVLENHPRSYNLEPLAGLVRAKYRIGGSKYWAGLGYALASTQVDFDAPDKIPGLQDLRGESRVGGFAPTLSYDSRDNMFTPSKGTFVELTAGFFAPAFGGDDEFQRSNLTAIQYVPLHPDVIMGVRGDATVSSGDVPFYMYPFIYLRGAPVMRYQGEEVAQAEAEVRWQCWKRFSVVGFGGYGVAWNDFTRVDNKRTVTTGGGGFRYEIARAYGLHMGADLAFGPDVTAIYIQFGSAWMRP